MADLDDALDHLRDYDRFELSSHGPMAAEALEALGFGSTAGDWAREYRASNRLEPIPPAPPLPDSQLDAALGDPQRRGAWIARLDQELEHDEWDAVARRWIPRLVPAAACDAAHGMIRTAHALRSIRRAQTPQRLHELAEALAYWASAYAELPGSPGRGKPEVASKALARIPVVPVAEQVWEGAITDRMNDLANLAGFEAAVSSLDPIPDLAAFTDDLARTAAHLYLANASRARTIDFIHAVDGVYAIRELLPFLDEAQARRLAFHGWQVVAGLHASAGGALPPASFQAPAGGEVPGLVARAVEVGGAHAIKFAQACLAEYERNPDPVFHACLADMVTRMEELKQKLGIVI